MAKRKKKTSFDLSILYPFSATEEWQQDVYAILQALISVEKERKRLEEWVKGVPEVIDEEIKRKSGVIGVKTTKEGILFDVAENLNNALALFDRAERKFAASISLDSILEQMKREEAAKVFSGAMKELLEMVATGEAELVKDAQGVKFVWKETTLQGNQNHEHD